MHLCPERGEGENDNELTKKGKNNNKNKRKSLALGEVRKSTLWPTLNFKKTAFDPSGFSAEFRFCVHYTPGQGKRTGENYGQNTGKAFNKTGRIPANKDKMRCYILTYFQF